MTVQSRSNPLVKLLVLLGVLLVLPACLCGGIMTLVGLSTSDPRPGMSKTLQFYNSTDTPLKIRITGKNAPEDKKPVLVVVDPKFGIAKSFYKQDTYRFDVIEPESKKDLSTSITFGATESRTSILDFGEQGNFVLMSITYFPTTMSQQEQDTWEKQNKENNKYLFYKDGFRHDVPRYVDYAIGVTTPEEIKMSSRHAETRWKLATNAEMLDMVMKQLRKNKR